MAVVKLNPEELNEPVMEEPTEEEQVEQETVDLGMTTEEVVDAVGSLLAMMKAKTPQGQRMFLERYKMINTFILKLIGFDSALQQVPVVALPPSARLMLGAGILLLTGFMIKVDETQYVVDDGVGRTMGQPGIRPEDVGRESAERAKEGESEGEESEERIDIEELLKQLRGSEEGGEKE